jgi:hypothetical protein
LNFHFQDALLDRLQRAAFAYPTEYSNPDTGLVADTSRGGSPSSIAVVGFALSSCPGAVAGGWVSRRAARCADLEDVAVLLAERAKRWSHAVGQPRPIEDLFRSIRVGLLRADTHGGGRVEI